MEAMRTISQKIINFLIELIIKVNEEDIFTSDELPLTVDYDNPLALGCDEDINLNNFPVQKTGSEKIVVKLFNFDHWIECPGVSYRMELNDFRPARPEELAAFGHTYPNLQEAYEPIALGYIWKNIYKYAVRFNRKKKKIVLCYANDDWSPLNSFLGVKI